MSTYAWIITRDYLAEQSASDDNRAGVIGPSAATDEQVAALKVDGKPESSTAFRMYDDDGELYYSGYYLGDPTSEDAFGPLDDFGAPDSGCTEIRYRQPDGKWTTL